MSSKKLTGLAMLSAISLVLVSIFHIPIFPAVPFLEFDFADIPIFLATFMYGPITGLLLTAIVCVLQGVTVSIHSGIFGILMHFFATGSFVLVAGLIYKYHKTLKGAIVAIISGILTWVVVMTGFNLLITPLFMKVDRSTVVGLLGWITAFNAIKATANSLATFLIYKYTHKIFAKHFDAGKKKPKPQPLVDLSDNSATENTKTDKNQSHNIADATANNAAYDIANIPATDFDNTNTAIADIDKDATVKNQADKNLIDTTENKKSDVPSKRQVIANRKTKSSK